MFASELAPPSPADGPDSSAPQAGREPEEAAGLLMAWREPEMPLWEEPSAPQWDEPVPLWAEPGAFVSARHRRGRCRKTS